MENKVRRLEPQGLVAAKAGSLHSFGGYGGKRGGAKGDTVKTVAIGAGGQGLRGVPQRCNLTVEGLAIRSEGGRVALTADVVDRAPVDGVGPGGRIARLMAGLTIGNLELARLHGGNVEALVVILSRLAVTKGDAVDFFQGLAVDRPLLPIHDELFRRDGLRLLLRNFCVALYTGEVPMGRAVKRAHVNEHRLVALGAFFDQSDVLVT